MLSFIVPFALAQIAATLLASGAGHVVRFAPFRALIGEHGVVPRRCALPVALGVLMLELVVGGAALVLLFAATSPRDHALVFITCALLGGAFALYLRVLLRRASRGISCGCSPVSSPLTPASLVPSIALMGVSLTGVAAILADQAASGRGDADR